MDIGDTNIVPKFIIACVLTFLSLNTFAQVSLKLKEYDLMSEKEKEATLYYIAGIGNGISWSNVALVETKQRPLYCAPAKFALGLDNYKSFIDLELKKAKSNTNKWAYENMELGHVMLLHLQEVFPCNGTGTYGK
jgi:hypothetical protein